MQIGDYVDDFELLDERGEPRTLKGMLANGPVVLFFYPAAFTAGCTAEVCHFRDVTQEFKALGAQPVGISPDSVERQAGFAKKHSLGYPLLSDAEGKVRAMFGVEKGLISASKRITFVIDTDGRVLEIIRSELRMNVHADKALEALRQRV